MENNKFNDFQISTSGIYIAACGTISLSPHKHGICVWSLDSKNIIEIFETFGIPLLLSWSPVFYGDIIAVLLEGGIIEIYVRIGSIEKSKFILYKRFLLSAPNFRHIKFLFNPSSHTGFLLGCLSALNIQEKSVLDTGLIQKFFPHGLLTIFSPPLSSSITSLPSITDTSSVEPSTFVISKKSFCLSPLKIDEELMLGKFTDSEWNRMVVPFDDVPTCFCWEKTFFSNQTFSHRSPVVFVGCESGNVHICYFSEISGTFIIAQTINLFQSLLNSLFSISCIDVSSSLLSCDYNLLSFVGISSSLQKKPHSEFFLVKIVETSNHNSECPKQHISSVHSQLESSASLKSPLFSSSSTYKTPVQSFSCSNCNKHGLGNGSFHYCEKCRKKRCERFELEHEKKKKKEKKKGTSVSGEGEEESEEEEFALPEELTSDDFVLCENCFRLWKKKKKEILKKMKQKNDEGEDDAVVDDNEIHFSDHLFIRKEFLSENVGIEKNLEYFKVCLLRSRKTSTIGDQLEFSSCKFDDSGVALSLLNEGGDVFSLTVLEEDN